MYVYSASIQSASSAAAERWARDQMQIHDSSRGEIDVVSMMTQHGWKETILDRRSIGD